MVTNTCSYIQVLTAPIPGLEDIAQVLADINITLANLSIEDGYNRLYGIRVKDKDRRAGTILLYLYKIAIESWINEDGASNFMTSAEFLNVLAEAEKIRQTCECYNLN